MEQGLQYMEAPFDQWLAELESVDLEVDPEDINFEARQNFWSLGLSSAQAQLVSESTVLAFIDAIEKGWAKTLEKRGYTSETFLFYCWHDAQVGQLRFSLVSACHGRLPFRCKTERVESAESVVASWLEWLRVDDFESEEPDREESEYVLSVYAAPIPKSRLP